MDVDASAERDAVVADWLHDRAVPLARLEPPSTGPLAADDQDLDLRRLTAGMAGARVIGLGEANHGAREFFQLKHRVVRFLVEEKGFRAFAIEAPYSTGRAIDDYVRFGRGSLPDVLTGLRYLPWDNEVLMALLAWMREFNDGVPDEVKVKFWGIDLFFSGAGAPFLRSFLARVAPDREAQLVPVLDAIVLSDECFPSRKDDIDIEASHAGIPLLDDLIGFVTANRADLVARSSEQDCDAAEMLLTAMRQWSRCDESTRSSEMGENLINLLDKDGADTKVVVWAHNCHVWRTTESSEQASAGRVLQRRFGEQYVAWVLESGKGSYQTRTFLESGQATSLGTTPIEAPAPAGSLASWCEGTGIGDLGIDLRDPAPSQDVESWLGTELRIRDGSWAAKEPADCFTPVRPGGAFDGILFIEEVSPARPSPQARLNGTAGRYP